MSRLPPETNCVFEEDDFDKRGINPCAPAPSVGDDAANAWVCALHAVEQRESGVSLYHGAKPRWPSGGQADANH